MSAGQTTTTTTATTATGGDGPIIRAALIDISGTLHVGRDAVPGAVSACRRLFQLQREGRSLGVLFLTNTSQVPSGELLTRLRQAGFDETAIPSAGHVMTSVGATRRFLLDNGLRPYCLVEDALLETDLRDVDTNDPNCVLVGLAPGKFDYERLNAAYRLLLRWRGEDEGAARDDDGRRPPPPPRLIAVHRSTRHRDADGGMSLGPGGFVSLLEGAVPCVSARVVGKPSRDFYLAALSRLGVDDPSGAVMVGDDVVGDVGGALATGFGGAILVRTGKYVAGDETPAAGAGGVAPTLTVDSIVEAVDYIVSNSG
jgi:HAD superfamily hydrolase (TIGR01458 family)